MVRGNQTKASGGLGIVPLQVRNQVFLCKWTWRLGKEREALWAKVLAARYGLGEEEVGVVGPTSG